MTYFGFLKEFLRSPSTTGAIAPSSAALADRMVEWIDWSATNAVAELGVGTGAFTAAILQRMTKSCRYIAVESNPNMCRIFSRRFPELTIYGDSVANLEAICRNERVEALDSILCGLPWASFSSRSQLDFMDAIVKCLRKGGTFATFAYLQGLLLPGGAHLGRMLSQRFREARRSEVVWRNLPPAFVYRCRI
jgi:phosphatidylethanolamine/phosphatidyl-N-methylethanolamine N-methyltransferase